LAELIRGIDEQEFTAPTRPRITFGLESCTSEKRITTLMGLRFELQRGHNCC
jgi:hypothetical protein